MNKLLVLFISSILFKSGICATDYSSFGKHENDLALNPQMSKELKEGISSWMMKRNHNPHEDPSSQTASNPENANSEKELVNEGATIEVSSQISSKKNSSPELQNAKSDDQQQIRNKEEAIKNAQESRKKKGVANAPNAPAVGLSIGANPELLEEHVVKIPKKETEQKDQNASKSALKKSSKASNPKISQLRREREAKRQSSISKNPQQNVKKKRKFSERSGLSKNKKSSKNLAPRTPKAKSNPQSSKQPQNTLPQRPTERPSVPAKRNNIFVIKPMTKAAPPSKKSQSESENKLLSPKQTEKEAAQEKFLDEKILSSPKDIKTLPKNESIDPEPFSFEEPYFLTDEEDKIPFNAESPDAQGAEKYAEINPSPSRPNDEIDLDESESGLFSFENEDKLNEKDEATFNAMTQDVDLAEKKEENSISPNAPEGSPVIADENSFKEAHVESDSIAEIKAMPSFPIEDSSAISSKDPLNEKSDEMKNQVDEPKSPSLKTRRLKRPAAQAAEKNREERKRIAKLKEKKRSSNSPQALETSQDPVDVISEKEDEKAVNPDLSQSLQDEPFTTFPEETQSNQDHQLANPLDPSGKTQDQNSFQNH